MTAVRTRIAPTPSGYLHLGNAWSFVITWLLARSRGGSIHLRGTTLEHTMPVLHRHNDVTGLK